MALNRHVYSLPSAERRARVQSPQNGWVTEAMTLRRGYDLVEPPAVRRADVHVLDEAQDVAGLARPPGELDDPAVVLAALEDDVDLHGPQPGLDRGIDPVEHLRDREVDAVHPPEDLVVERVERDRDAPQPGVGQWAREMAERRAVGGQRQVDRLVLRRTQRREHGHEAGQAAADRRR